MIAESAVIIEYIVEKFGHLGTGELAHLAPAAGTPAYWQARYWMHYAEGSLMNWLVMKLVFSTHSHRGRCRSSSSRSRAACATRCSRR